jgi:tripartite-type tricarboxylate transporter receptor subunit TctC
MKRNLVAASALTTMALALSACGSDGGSDGGSSAAEGEAAGCALDGETIEMIVPFSPGGGYDQYARQLAPALGEELGADVVVINNPGAGGLLATNELANAEPDGTSLGIFNMTGHVGSALAEASGVQYDPTEFGYLGRISSEPDVVLVQAAGPHETFQDLVDAAGSGPVRFAATGPGSNEYVDPVVLEQVLGLDIEIVTGYEGGSEAALGLIQGDVDAHSRSLYSQLPAVTAGDARAALVLGSEPAKELPGVPTVVELAENDEQRELLEFHARLIESGRAFAVPPGVEDGCLEELRTAYETVVTDAEFVAAGEEGGRPISFSSGADVQQEVEALMDAPQEYVDILKEAYSGA